jgi:hypothetical protein
MQLIGSSPPQGIKGSTDMDKLTGAEQYFATHAPPYIHRLRHDLPNIGKWDACAIMGNAGHECLGFTKMQEMKPTVPGSRGGYGWMQWTGPRRRAYEAFCAKRNVDASTMEANYMFLLHELTETFEKKALPAIIAVVPLDQKVEVFEKEYLRAGIKHYDARKRWARIALFSYETWLASQGVKFDPPTDPNAPVIANPTPPSEPTKPRSHIPQEVAKGSLAAIIMAAIAAIGWAIYHFVGGG